MENDVIVHETGYSLGDHQILYRFIRHDTGRCYAFRIKVKDGVETVLRQYKPLPESASEEEVAEAAFDFYHFVARALDTPEGGNILSQAVLVAVEAKKNATQKG